MSVEVWFRNPKLYIRECAELHVTRFAWDRGFLRNAHVDPTRYLELYLPGVDYRMLLVGDQGTAELRPGYTIDRPFAVYPTWDYEMDKMATLERLVANPASQSERHTDHSLTADERAVPGQEHRVVVIRSPSIKRGIGQKFIFDLEDLQNAYPECILHFHGSYSYRTMFEHSFRSVDVDPRTDARGGHVYLPNGQRVHHGEVNEWSQWAHLIGYSTTELESPRRRCMFNIQSALWAGEHYKSNVRFQTKRSKEIEIDIEAIQSEVPQTTSTRSRYQKLEDGDRVLCDMCSIQKTCKLFRAGGVCAIPNTEPARLSALFQSRDPDKIIDGLASLQAANMVRLERAMAHEAAIAEMIEDPEAVPVEDSGTRINKVVTSVIDPEVTKLMSNVFDSGVKIARLLDPKRFSTAGKIVVNAGNVAAVQGANPAALAAGFIAELEAQGVDRKSITREMLEKQMGAVIDVPAIEGPDGD